jgi:hypothetical protein
VSHAELIRSLCPAVVIGAGLLLFSCDRANQDALDSGSPGGGEVAPAPAQPVAPPTPPPSANVPLGAPQITFDKTSHEFGAITDAGKHTAEFGFTNTGTGTLVISDIKTSCGCTVPQLDKREFMPGERSTLKVIFDPINRKGGFIKYVFVASNSAANSYAKLSVTADITQLVRFDSIFLGLGPMELGRAQQRSFSGYYTDPDLRITRIVSDNPHVTAKLLRTSKVPRPGEEGDEYRAVMVITIDNTAPWGLIDPGKLTVFALGSTDPGHPPREAQYVLFLSGQLYGDLRADPDAFSIEQVLRVGQSFEASVVISSVSGTYFAVVDAVAAESNDNDLEVRVEPINPSSYRISILAGSAFSARLPPAAPWPAR